MRKAGAAHYKCLIGDYKTEVGGRVPKLCNESCYCNVQHLSPMSSTLRPVDQELWNLQKIYKI